MTHARHHFLRMIWRVGIGSLSLAALVVPALKMAAYIGANYSVRRKVGSGTAGDQRVPIMSFQTQQLPILHALAQGFVLDAFYRRTTAWLTEIPLDNMSLRNAISAIVKATMTGHWRRTGITIVDRCGAQGMFDFNLLLPMEVRIRACLHLERWSLTNYPRRWSFVVQLSPRATYLRCAYVGSLYNFFLQPQ